LFALLLAISRRVGGGGGGREWKIFGSSPRQSLVANDPIISFGRLFCVSRFVKLEKLVTLTQALFPSTGRDGARLPVCFTEGASWNAGTSSKMSLMDNERLSTWSTGAALTIAGVVGAERFSMTTAEASGNAYHAYIIHLFHPPPTHMAASATQLALEVASSPLAVESKAKCNCPQLLFAFLLLSNPGY